MEQLKDCDFSMVHIHCNNDGYAKREIIKNDTVLTIYKNRWYQMSKETGIRYPYSPTNQDLQAKDWILLFDLDQDIQRQYMINILQEQLARL